MKIKKVILKNIRCFEYLEIELSEKGESNDWTILLGDNGCGKTTLMRSIAICLCEETGAAGLLDELASDWFRKEDIKEEASIRLEFEPIPDCEIPYIETILTKNKYGELELEQKPFPDDRKIWEGLFICGYGANRRSYGTTSYSEYTVTDAIYSMFNYDTSMQNIELNLRRIGEEIELDGLFRKMEHILMLEENAIKLERNGIFVNGKWGSYVPIGSLGDGYQATMAWIMDMYGWKLLYEKKLENAEVSGIVFVDELEQHLHPIWQREVIKRLSEQFPDIQFIVTTHSPVIALNSYSLGSKFNSKHFVLNWEGNKVVPSVVQEPMSDLGYDQVLGSEAFGHIYEKNKEIPNILGYMSDLASKDELNQKEKELLDSLKFKLKGIMFPDGKTLVERIVERDYYEEIEKRTSEFDEIIKKSQNK